MLMFYSWQCMAAHEISHFSAFIYSSPARAWLGPDNSETAWGANTTPQRVIQAVITHSKKHANAGKRQLLSERRTPFSSVSELCGPAANWPDSNTDSIFIKESLLPTRK